MQTQAKSDEKLTPELIHQLKRHGDTRTFHAHAIVINEGDSTDSLYVVLSGRLVVYSSSDSGREVVLAEYGAGEYFGELALDGERRSASVRAVETSTCCIVQGPQLRALLDELPGLATHLVYKLIGMVRSVTRQVTSLALQDTYGRLARVLVSLSEPAGEERILRQKLTQQDLADRIASSREMVNRLLKELMAGGYVALRDGRYVICRKLPLHW